MKNTARIVSAILVLFASSANAEKNVCTQVVPLSNVYVNVYNKCDRCMTAAFAWCDGSVHHLDVPAKSTAKLQTCVGSMALVDEDPCGAAVDAKKPN